LKEIGILELKFHIKYLYTIAKICKTKDTRVTIFTTEDVLSKLETYLTDTSNYNIVLKKEKECINTFLKRVKKICNEKIDLLFINTFPLSVFYIPRFFGFRPKCKTIITLHTVNAWLKPKPVFNIKKLVRTIDTNLSVFIANKIILPKFDAISVIYPPIKDYILKETNYDKKVFTLPFNFFEKQVVKKIQHDKKIKFVVPGQIEEHRRDYDVVLDAFEKLFEKHNKSIELCFLGYPVGIYGNRIIKRCKKLQDMGYHIEYFKSFVPEDSYNEAMKNVDFIILPIKVKSRGLGLIPEFYGTSKGSAAVFEAIQYSKPFIAPNDFKITGDLKSSTMQYNNSEDMEKQLANYIGNIDKINFLKDEANKNSKSFSLDVLQDYFTNEILKNLDDL
jgi:hypothetical protein